jgi:hypothetical protein
MMVNVTAVPVNTTPWCQVKEEMKENVTGRFYIVLPASDGTTARRIYGTELAEDTAECKTFFKADGKVNERSECPW